jgi:opacity protein-like surface antigen
MKKVIFASLFSMLFAFSFNAYSAEGKWYMSGNIGMSSLNNSDMGFYDEEYLEMITGEDIPAGASVSAELGYDAGPFLGVAVGYDFGNYRLESEFGYMKNDMDELSVRVNIPGEGSLKVGEPMDGDLSSFTVLFNGYYDFCKGSKLRPYITAGIGYSRVEAQVSDMEDGSEDDSVFAYQAGAGIGWDVSEIITLDLKYRYFGTSDPLDIDYSSHSVSLGLRYSF